MAEADVRDSTEMAFEVYGKQIQSVLRFKYLGRILTEGDDESSPRGGQRCVQWKGVRGGYGHGQRFECTSGGGTCRT